MYSYSTISKDKQIIAAGENIREKDFWVKKLSGNPVITKFPYNNTKTAREETRVETVTFRLESQLFPGLMKASTGSDYKLHILLAAGVVVLLGKYSPADEANKDALIASPIYKPGIEGEFINTILPLRIRQDPGMTFKEILRGVSQAIIEATEHQNYPVQMLFESGTDEVAVPEIAVLLENIHDRQHIGPLKPVMLFSFHRDQIGIDGQLEYHAALYETWFPPVVVNHLFQLLGEVISRREEPVARFEILSAEEKLRLSKDMDSPIEKVEAPPPVPAPPEETITYTAPRNKIEEQLEIIWAEVLEQERTSIGIDANFFQLNGNSLRTIMLISRIFKEFNVRLPLAEVFKQPTVRQLAGYLEGAVGTHFEAIEPTVDKEYYVLSSAQKRLYFIQQLDLDSDVYNVPDVQPLGFQVDMQRLKKTVRKMIVRHDSFRTSFEMKDGEPLQKIHPPYEIELNIEYYEVSEERTEEVIKNFVRPFDLRQPPLLRMGVLKLENIPNTYLMHDMHHIITDAFSKNIFIREFLKLYHGEELPPLKLQYKDYAEWQNSEAQKEAARRREVYWLNVLKGEIPALCLPTDNERPAQPNFKGSTLGFRMEPGEIKALYKHARDEEVTIFMLLLGIYLVMLSKLSGQEDIIVGTVNAGRSHVDLENIVGMFVNTLALRNRVDPEKTFANFLQDVKANTLEAFENQDYQFEDLVDKVAVNRGLNRSVIFDVLLVVGNIDLRAEENKEDDNLPEIKQKTIGYQNRTSKFDMTLFYHEGEEIFEWEYSRTLFKEETIKEFISYLREIATIVIRDPHIKVKDIKISHDLLESDSTVPQMEFEF